MSCSAGAHLHSSGVPRIPLFKPAAQYGPLLPELKQRLGDVLDGGEFILGPNVRAFEEEAAAYLGVPRTIGVANGTDAIVLVLRALEIGPGDEVVCPAFTFYATAEAIASVGATPVFADIDAATLNLDPADVERRVTPRTRAIMPVHLFGRPAALEELTALGLPLIEDAAQAFGARGVATTGVASTFSFYPTKNLGGIGDGGLVACLDDELAERADAPLPRLPRQARLRVRRHEFAAGRASGRRAATLPRAPRRLERAAPRGRRAVRRAGSRRARRAARRRRRARLPPLRRAYARARASCGRAGRGRDRQRLVLRDAAPSAARPSLPRLERGLAARDRARRPREPRAADVGGIDAETQERVVAAVRDAVTVGVAS